MQSSSLALELCVVEASEARADRPIQIAERAAGRGEGWVRQRGVGEAERGEGWVRQIGTDAD